jgi:hypothetical protein
MQLCGKSWQHLRSAIDMPVAVSPAPNDGPLGARGPTVKLNVSATSSCAINVFLRTPDGARVRAENLLLGEGNSTIVISLPPNGVPAGTKLIVVMDELDGHRTIARYTLK